MSHFYREFIQSDLFKKMRMSRTTFLKYLPAHVCCPKGRNDLCPHCVALSKVRADNKISDEKWENFMESKIVLFFPFFFREKKNKQNNDFVLTSFQ